MFCVPIAPDLRTSLFFPCLLTTTSDSFIVRMVGVEPTILTTIGIRLLSTQSFILPVLGEPISGLEIS